MWTYFDVMNLMGVIRERTTGEIYLLFNEISKTTGASA